MAFEFVCPYCHLKTWVDDQFSGQSGPCAGCSKQVTMPIRSKRLQDVLQPPALPRMSKPMSSVNTTLLFQRIGMGAVMLVMASVIVWFAAMPAIHRMIVQRNRATCLNNLKQIAQALNTYALKHGTYPTPTVVDSKGVPLYSWRVLILPELGYQSVYENFQLDQAWNSPTNIALISMMPQEFASPASVDATSLHNSNYSLLTGPGTLFPKSGPLSPSAVLDDPSQTLLVVETSNANNAWSAPSDIDVTRGIRMGTRAFVDIGGNHQEGATAVCVDGTKIFLPKMIVQSVLDAIITPAGGERVAIGELVQ